MAKDSQNPFCRVLGVEEIKPLNGNHEQLPLDILANQAESIDQKKFNYQGNVRADRGDQRLRADFVHYDSDNGMMEAWDNVQLIEPGQHAVGSHARIDQEANTGILDNAAYRVVARHASGRADQIIKEGDWIRRYVGDATYSTCDPDRRSWELKADEVRLDLQEGWGEAWNSKLYLGSIPVFYSPYQSFPIDDRRKSGFLAPTIGSSDSNGLETIVPWYWNIAPNQDALVQPRYYEERGLLGEIEHRYLNQSFSGITKLAYMPEDSLYGNSRYAVEIKYQGGEVFAHTSGVMNDLVEFDSERNGWGYEVNYGRLSDKDYIRDFGENLSITSTTHLEQSARALYTADDWNVSIRAQDWYTVDKSLTTQQEPYRKFPEVSGAWSKEFNDEQLLALGDDYFNLSLNGSWTLFDHPTKIGGSRITVTPSASYRKNFLGKSIYLEPSVKVEHIRYNLDSLVDTSPSRTTPTYNLTAGLFLERELENNSGAWLGLGEEWIQSLEPTITYTYVPSGRETPLSDFGESNSTLISAEDSALLQDTFVGADRKNPVNMIKTGVTTRFIDSETGTEFFTGLIEQGRSFNDHDEPLTILHARGEARIDHHYSYYDLTWDHYDVESKTHKIGLELRPNKNIFNTEYSYARDSKEQIDLSGVWKFKPNWSAIGRYKQDLFNDQLGGSHLLERLIGIEYSTCCWAARVTNQKYQIGSDLNGPTYDQVWFFVLELKGLTGLGGRQSLEETLEESIIGYTQKPLAAY
jgi:LPS-assembly protein